MHKILRGGALPTGVITIWSGTANNIPTGWALCDGTNGTPDLRDKFVLGAGTHEVGETGGSEEVTLTVAQMPSHTHNLSCYNVDGSSGSPVIRWSIKPSSNNDNPASMLTATRGNSKPHENMPPYYTLCYIMKL